MTDVLIKSGNVNTDWDTGRMPYADTGKDQGDAAEAKDSCRPPKARRGPGSDSASQLSEGTNSVDNLILDF